MGDQLLVGDTGLRIARVITLEPDRGAGFMSFAPRVMINQADVARTGLVQPASRVSYRFAVAGDAAAVQRFSDEADAQIKKGELRGARLDETKPGSGLGLSIVVELAGLYGGVLTLGTAPIGGLRTELALPGG